MSSDLLNMNWFFNDAECWNPDMPPKYDENGDVVVTTTTEAWTLPQQDGNHLSHALITVESPQTTFSQLSTATGAHKETTTSRSSLLKDLPPVPSHSTLESTLP